VTTAQILSGRLDLVQSAVRRMEAPDAYPVIPTIIEPRVTERSGLQPGDALLSKVAALRAGGALLARFGGRESALDDVASDPMARRSFVSRSGRTCGFPDSSR
jgi:hypothetical protein